MGETCLSLLCMNAVICGIAVGYENAVESESEEMLGHFRRAMTVDMKEGEIAVP
jgi:hypothetical protein